MRLIRKARFFWVYPLAIWLFVSASISERSLRLGVALALLGEALRLWANGHVGHVKVNETQRGSNAPKIGRLVTAGPYAYVRHPLYVGTFLVGVGFCVVVRSAWLVLAALAFFFLVYRGKVRSEEATILHEWGEDYEAYRRAVPRWVPTFRRYPHGEGSWTWQGIWASKEPKTLAWVIVALVALYFREEFFQERNLFAGAHWAKRVVWLAVVVVLIVSDGVFELIRWSRRSRERAASTAAPGV